MTDEITKGTSVSLPTAPAGWFDYNYSVLWSGHLALIRTDRDFHAGDRQLKVRLRLSRFDGRTETGAIEVVAGPGPKVDCLADGRWLVASAISDENNAHLFATDGTPAGAFSIGHHILHVRCAPDGTIWVGYFDEGVYAGTAQISSSGIARFASNGAVLWRFNNEAGANLSIDDCYALTLDRNTLWCCPYSNFPVVRIENGRIAHWKNEIAGAVALAVEGDNVLLAGGYKENADRIALVRLLGNQAQQIGEWRFSLPPKTSARLLQGVGPTLHIIGQSRWTKLSVPTLCAALQS